MNQWPWTSGHDAQPTGRTVPKSGERLLTDGGHEREDEETEDPSDSADATDTEDDEVSSGGGSNVEVTAAGEAEPAEPKWEKPDIESIEDIPEITGPKTRPADPNPEDTSTDEKGSGQATADTNGSESREPGTDPTAGMPNTARSPGQSRLKNGGTDGYVVALELCARLPDDIRLPEEAADLVPVALEAELEGNVQQFAGEHFDNPSPHVETLDFVEANDEIWLRLRLGIPPKSFDELDPDEIREHALQKLEGML